MKKVLMAFVISVTSVSLNAVVVKNSCGEEVLMSNGEKLRVTGSLAQECRNITATLHQDGTVAVEASCSYLRYRNRLVTYVYPSQKVEYAIETNTPLSELRIFGLSIISVEDLSRALLQGVTFTCDTN